MAFFYCQLFVISSILKIIVNCQNVKKHGDILLENCPVANGFNSPNEANLEPQNVSMYFRPTRFIEINDVRESFAILGVVQLTWKVECVSKLYANRGTSINNWPQHVSYIGQLDNDRFWIPVVTLYNTIDNQNIHFDRLRSWINDGLFQADSPQIFTSFCDLDFYHFPYDRQQCSFHFIVVEDVQFVRLTQAKLRMSSIFDKFIPENSNWRLENASSEWQQLVPTEHADHFFSSATFTFVFQRQPDYYLLNLLMPSFLLALLELSSFFLTPSSTDRAAYAVTIMLSVMVVQNSFLSLLPNTPKPILVAYYAAGNTIFAAFCAIYSSFLCYFINNHSKIAERHFKIGIIIRKTCKFYTIVDLIAFSLSFIIFMVINIGAFIFIQTL